MRDIRFTPEVIKELRRLVRDVKHREALHIALTKIYQAGYDNATKELTKQIRRAVHAQHSANIGNHNDGKQLQSDGSIDGERQGADAVDANSGEGSPTPYWSGIDD